MFGSDRWMGLLLFHAANRSLICLSGSAGARLRRQTSPIKYSLNALAKASLPPHPSTLHPPPLKCSRTRITSAWGGGSASWSDPAYPAFSPPGSRRELSPPVTSPHPSSARSRGSSGSVRPSELKVAGGVWRICSLQVRRGRTRWRVTRQILSDSASSHSSHVEPFFLLHGYTRTGSPVGGITGGGGARSLGLIGCWICGVVPLNWCSVVDGDPSGCSFIAPLRRRVCFPFSLRPRPSQSGG